MTYRDTLTRLSTSTEAAVVELHARLDAGEITEEEFVELAAVAVARGNARAVSLADLALSASVTVALRRAVPVLGLPAPDDRPRLRRAATTLLERLPGSEAPVARVARLGRSEPLTTAARAYSAGMAARPEVTGWTRGVSGNACQLCQWWYRDGRVWPSTHPMPIHKGCTCTPIPTVSDRAPRPVQR